MKPYLIMMLMKEALSTPKSRLRRIGRNIIVIDSSSPVRLFDLTSGILRSHQSA